MNKIIISLVVLSALSMSAHAMSIADADAEVARSERAVESAHEQVIHNIHSVSHTTMQDDRDLMNAAGEMRAQAYADQRAAVQEAQNKQDTADKAEMIAERDARTAAARLNTPSATASRSLGWTMAPGIIKESNPEGHPTHQVDPMDPHHWTQTPGVVKESNPEGHPTHQIAPATRLDSSTADHQAAKAAAKAAMAQHKAELSQYGIKQSGTATYSEPAHAVSYSGTSSRPNTGATNTMLSGIKNDPTGTPTHQQSPDMGKSLTQANIARTEQQAVALADARQAEADSQVKEHAKDIANYGVKRTSTATYNEQPHAMTYSGITTRPNTGATINVAANTLKPDTRIQVTDRTTGRKSVVKASTLTPSTQISVPFHDVFQHSVKGGNSHENAVSHGDHGTGTGADNAHDHAFGGHDGAGGGFHM